MSDKQRWEHGEAMLVAEEVSAQLEPFCERLLICGSLRRKKATVGDIEIVYVPRFREGAEPVDMFTPPAPVNLLEEALGFLLARGYLAKRLNVNGSPAWGPKNKLGIHCASRIPVDFFAATPANWWNYVVCRTGGAESNTQIASLAQRKGWMWHPYDIGFECRRGPERREIHEVKSEADVFAFVGLAYREPEERK